MISRFARQVHEFREMHRFAVSPPNEFRGRSSVVHLPSGTQVSLHNSQIVAARVAAFLNGGSHRVHNRTRLLRLRDAAEQFSAGDIDRAGFVTLLRTLDTERDGAGHAVVRQDAPR